MLCRGVGTASYDSAAGGQLTEVVQPIDSSM